MKRIWAPWRLEFILSQQKPLLHKKANKNNCVFCTVAQGKPSAANLVLYKGQTAYVVMNRYPYVAGHLMVIPYRHLANLGGLTDAEHAEMGGLLTLSQQVLAKVCKPHGYNIGMNLGEAAGAGIKEHLHYHIVPRWNGDHNFMPVIGEVRVMLEHLVKTYKKLKVEFDQLVIKR